VIVVSLKVTPVVLPIFVAEPNAAPVPFARQIS
jgi:hypothetical protein